MNNQNKLPQIEKMLNKKWTYKGVHYSFLNYRSDGDKITIATKEKWFDFDDRNELANFLQDCYPVKETAVEVAISAPTDKVGLTRPNSSSGNITAYLKGILVEDIERVREDPSYVEQAKTVSNNVKRVVDIAKLELQIKQLNKKDKI